LERRRRDRDGDRPLRGHRSDGLVEGDGRPRPHRNRDRHGDRQDADDGSLGGRRGDDDLDVFVVVVPLRQQIDRSARRRRRLADDGDDLGHLDGLDDRERRRQILVDHLLEDDRGLDRRGEAHEPAAGIGHVRAALVAAQIGPVRLAGIAGHGPPPHHGLTPGREDRRDAPGHGMARVTAQEGLVVRDRVALDGDRIGLVRGRVLDPAHLRPTRSRRRSGLDRFEEHEGHVFEIRGMPRGLEPIGRLVGAQADAGEHLVHPETRLAHLLDEGSRVGSISRALRILHRDVRRRGEADEEARGRFDEGKAARDGLPRGTQGIVPRHVGHDDAHPARCPVEGADEIGEAEALDGHIGLPGDPGVHRKEIVVALELGTVARKVDRDGGVRLGRLHLVEEVAHHPAQVRRGEIATLDHLEAGARQGLSHEAGIVHGGGQRAALIGSLPDDEGDPLLGRRVPGREGGDEQGGQNGEALEKPHDGDPSPGGRVFDRRRGPRG
jgi:hypothetical protein